MDERNAHPSFLGTGWSFPPTFDKSQASVIMISDEADIAQSLQILFSTFPGERIMVPRYGCNLRKFLFEQIDTSLMFQLRDIISNAILHFEPRIIVNQIDIDTDNLQEGVLFIMLDYTVRATNSRHNIVYPFYHSEGNLVAAEYSE